MDDFDKIWNIIKDWVAKGMSYKKCKALYNLSMNVSEKSICGDIAEVGVYKGGSAYILKQCFIEEKIHLFDTFCGTPSPISKYDYKKIVGHFRDTSVEKVKLFLNDSRVIIHEGLFENTKETVVDYTFSFVHLDCNIYEPTKEAIDWFYPRLITGGIMVFDDYDKKSGVVHKGIKKAVDNYLEMKQEKAIKIDEGQAYIVKM